MAAVTEIVETRRVGEQERLFHYLHGAGGLIASGVLHIRGPLSAELLRKALAWLQRQHPVLRAHIRYEGHVWTRVPPFYYPIPWLDTRGTSEIPFRIVENPDPEAWKAIFETENQTRIGQGQHPRMRMVLVREHVGAELSHLVMTFDHAIADAQAANMLTDQLFRYFADPEAMEGLEPVQQGLPPSLETGLAKKPDSGTRPYQPAVRFPVTDVVKPERVSRTVERRIGANVAEALRANIRAHRTTMHGAVGAAFLVAARDKFGMDEMTVLSTVELRRMMKPPLPTTAFGCYIDILRTHHAIVADYWSMAADLSFKLISTLARDQHSASIMKLVGWDVYKIETMPTMRHRRRIDGIAITTAGDSHIAGQYGPFSLEGMSQSVSISMFGPSLFVVTNEKEGAIEMAVGYAADALSKADAEDLSDRALTALLLAAK